MVDPTNQPESWMDREVNLKFFYGCVKKLNPMPVINWSGRQLRRAVSFSPVKAGLLVAAALGAGAGGAYVHRDLVSSEYPTNVIERKLDSNEYVTVVQNNGSLTDFLSPGESKTGQCRSLDSVMRNQLEAADIDYQQRREGIVNKYGGRN